MEEIARRRPIDRTAAQVVSAGPRGLESSKRIARAHSDVPLPMIPMPRFVKDLRGRVIGSLTVIGLAVPTSSTRKKKGRERLWVCRCVCGYYTTRRAKAINSSVNGSDACDRCLQVMWLKQNSTWRQLGAV